jgi:hypothetical protein
MINRFFKRGWIKAETGGKASLRVNIHQQHSLAEFGTGRSQRSAARSFSHSSLLIRERENAWHWC